MYAISAGSMLLLMILITLIILAVIILYIIQKIRRAVRSTMGTSVRTLFNQMQEAEVRQNTTPRSLSGGDVIYEPMILKDFPQFHKNTVFAKAKKCLTDCLDAIENKNIDKVKREEYGDGVLAYVGARIGDSQKVDFDGVRIHRSCISGYRKTSQYATVVIQMSYEYSLRINGANAGVKQLKAELEYTYAYKNSDNGKVIGTVCPTCGGPIETATQTECEYCGTGIIGIVERIWVFTNIKDA